MAPNAVVSIHKDDELLDNEALCKFKHQYALPFGTNFLPILL